MTSISDQNLLSAAQKQHDNISRSPDYSGMASVLTKGKLKYSDMASFMTPSYISMACTMPKDRIGSDKDLVAGSSVLAKDQMSCADLTKDMANPDLLNKPSLDMASVIRSENPSPCPRCQSLDTKFCYFNNYNTKQPRHFCRSCQRYWTAGGSLRNLPVGAGKRKHKSSSTPTTMRTKSQRYDINEDAECDNDLSLVTKPQRCTEINDDKVENLRPATNLQLCTQIVDDEDDELGEVISADAPSSSHSKIMKRYHQGHHLADGKILSEFSSSSKELSPRTHGFSLFSNAIHGPLSNTLEVIQEKEGEEGSSMHAFRGKHQEDGTFSQKGGFFNQKCEPSDQKSKPLCVNSTTDSYMDPEMSQSSSTIPPPPHALSPWLLPPMMAPWPWPWPPHMLNNNDVSAAFAHTSASFWPFPPPMWTPFGWSSIPWNGFMSTNNNNNSAPVVGNNEVCGQKQQDPLCTPKTLKIGDPNEVTYSSVLTMLGLKNITSPSSVSAFFNADSHAHLDGSKKKVGMKQDHPQQPIEVEKILHNNPAALARSIAFQEGK